MMIGHDHCTPFLSATLLSIEKPPVPVASLRTSLLFRLQELGGTDSAPRVIHKVKAPTFQDGNVDVGWIHYSETPAPAWYAGDDLKETRHHSIFIVKKGELVALAFSDPALRNTILADIRKRRLPLFESVKLLTSKQINDAFVRARVRTLWLSGAHRRTSTKADSKILTGLELEAALDPPGDQSYYFSSVRSTHDGLALNAARVIVGANPRNSRVWIGPSKDWKTFIRRVEALIDTAGTAVKTPSTITSPLPILASPIDGISGAKEPYDMAILPEAVSAEDDKKSAWLHEFSDAARFEISAKTGSPSFTAEVFWGQESYGRMEYEFSDGVDGSVSVKATPSRWNDSLDHHEEILKICSNTDLLTVYFDTGHTFAQGHFYTTEFRDARFKDWKWAKLAGFAVDREKPLDGKKLKIADIGTSNDTSLFGFVAKQWSYLLYGTAPTGWLICDDGSMESADFIHFDDHVDPPRLSLIHVKGSGSAAENRGISVSDYEIVVSQAVKNLRYLDRTNIAEKIGVEKDKKIASAVWRDGARQKSRKGVLKILNGLGSNLSKTVYVFQPRVRRSAVEKIAAQMQTGDLNHSEVRRLQQLDTLLLAARADCFSLGAEFHVIGEDDAAQTRAPRRKRR